MKKIYFFLLLIPIISNAQKKEQDKYYKIHAYGQIGGILNKVEFLGVGGILGLQMSKNLGFGIGVENYQIDKALSTTATPIFGDIRIFINSSKVVKPFFAANIGDYGWKYNSKTNFGTNEFINVDVNSKLFLGGEFGVWFNKKNKRNGFFVSASYKSVKFVATTTSQYYVRTGNGSGYYKKTSASSDNTDDFFALKFGFKF